MADHLLDGPGGGELTLPDGDRITKCDGGGHWIVWADKDAGQELIILDKKDGDGSLEVHGFSTVTIQGKKDGNGTLIVDADCGTFAIHEINGPGQTYLRNPGSKRWDIKDGDGNVYFAGKPPSGNVNGKGRVIRESSGGAGMASGVGAPVGAGGGILFDRTWRFQIIGMSASVELRIMTSVPGLVFRIVTTGAGQSVSMDFPVNGDQSFQVPVSIGSISIGVSGWSLSNSQISFDLSIRYVPPISFMPEIAVTTQRVVLSRSAIGAGLGPPISANLSPADLLALVQLQRLGTSSSIGPQERPEPAGLDLPPGIELLAGSTYDFGPNWRENRLIEPRQISGRGGVRWGNVEVYMQPGGNGHAEFLRWYSDDPTDLRFYFHVGSPLFGGGGRVIWNVYGTPQPWASASGSISPKNGVRGSQDALSTLGQP
jgi:hypothetical protein